jgi:hypothetical protein
MGQASGVSTLSKAENASSTFKLGFNCSQAVLSAFAEATKQGMPQKICPKLVQDAAEILEILI